MIKRNYGLPRRIPFLLMVKIRGSMIIFGGRDSPGSSQKISGAQSSTKIEFVGQHR